MSDFLIKDVPTGRLNALVKKIGGLDVMEGILDGTVEFAITPREILVRLFADEEILVGATTGEETIANAADVFDGFLDGDFECWGTNKPSGNATAEVPVEVHEMRLDANFRQMFAQFGELNKRCPSQGQVVNFCRQNSDKLRQDGRAAFFPFMVEGHDEPFVADVGLGGGKLGVYVYRLGDGDVWPAGPRHRVVILQLDA